MTLPQIILTVGLSLALLTTAFIIILYWIYAFSFKRAKKDCDKFDGLDSPHMAPYRDANRRNIAALSALEYEDVYIESADGLRLHARLRLTGEDSPIQLMCHGYRANPFRDFSGGALEALAHGHSILLIDQRASLGSEGNTITFGIKESHDVLLWAEYLAARFPKRKIILVGISMGGATVVAASEREMPKNVVCTVADCPFSVVKDELIHAAGKLGFPRAVYPFIRLSARLFGGFDTEDGDFTKAAANSKLPILILHGEADTLVPAVMSRSLEAAAPDKVRYIGFAGAEHGISYLTDKERYVDEFYRFIDGYIGDKTGTAPRQRK